MLVFPAWRSEFPREGCRVVTSRWMSAERFAPYIARPVALPPHPPQFEDEDSSEGSSPERSENAPIAEGVCGWRGCGGRFPSVARLSAHVARTHAHAHSDGLFYCGWKDCSRPHRGFNARYKMLVHVRTHTNERPHICNQCNKSFSRAENLKIHLRSHSGEKPYVCPYEGCGKAYSNSSDRFKHTRTHAVEKPYCCKVPGCNKRYTDPSSLRKHVKTYKHYTTEQTTRRESSDEVHSPIAFSPSKENSSSYTVAEPTSPLQASRPYNPPTSTTYSPPIPTYAPVLSETTVPTSMPYSSVNQLTYIRPLEPMYPIRIPTNEMSYMEYTQMYEHAYRSYYSSTINYPTIGSSITDKVFTYEDKPQIEEVSLKKVDSPPMYSPLHEEMPLNLICTKRREYKPVELMRRTDLPLDLSTKS